MTDYEERMNKEGKFIEANLANQKISELKRTRDLKMIKAAENRQIEEKNVLENKQYNELNQFNEEMDEKFKQLNDKFALLQSQLFDKHQNEIKQFIEQFENETTRTTPKPSKELITLNKQMDLYAKKKERFFLFRQLIDSVCNLFLDNRSQCICQLIRIVADMLLQDIAYFFHINLFNERQIGDIA